MKLKNIQDIGGCRAIISNKKKLNQIVRELKKNPIFKDNKGEIRFKNYITPPKEDGYRGYHLMGSFKDQHNKFKTIEL
jgi:ppGpp synthetase/RelA/SpoT-type nucleotidyltranferase